MNEKDNLSQEELDQQKMDRDFEELKNVGKKAVLTAVSTAAASWLVYQAKSLFEELKESFQEFINERKESE